MKRIFSLLVILLLAVVITACTKEVEEKDSPVISGLPATASIVEGDSINVLEGVTATDYNGRDILDSVTITVDPNTATIVNGVITPSEPGTYLVVLTVKDDLDQTATASLFLEVEVNLVVEEVGRVTYTFSSVSEAALQGFVAKEAGTVVDALTVSSGELVYTPIQMGNGDGDNQINKVLELQEGAVYTVEITARASREITGVAFIINDPTKGWAPYKGSWGNVIGTEDKTLSLSFSVDAFNDEAELLFNVGGQGTDPVTIYVTSINIISFINPQTDVYEFTDLATDGWSLVEDAGQLEATVTDGDVSIVVSQFAPGIWEQRLEHVFLTLEASKVYKLSYTIHTTAEIRYEFLARTEYQVINDTGFYVWSNPLIAANETRTVTHTFNTSATDVNEFKMIFQFGNQTAGSATITVSDVTITYYDDLSEEMTRFGGLSSGFNSYEQDPAKATLYIDTVNGLLVYDVENFGNTDWHNKVFFNEAVFKTGAKYRVEFVAYASRDIDGFFAINPVGQWNPKVTTMFDLTTTAQTFSFETDTLQQFDQTIELLFQFGQFNTGSAIIYFESITIIELR